MLASDRAFTEIVAEAEMPISPGTQDEMNELLTELIRRAQAAGALRADLVLDDIPMFMCGIGMAHRQAAPLPGRLAAPL